MAGLICYASRTGTKRNLDLLRAAEFRLLISAAGVWRDEGFPYALDNGRWSEFQLALKSGRMDRHLSGEDFDAARFRRLLRLLGARADWVVVPDIVTGGAASLVLTRAWLAECLDHCPRVLIAVQDGMHPRDIWDLLTSRVGVFVGGSTDWKNATLARWGRWCHARGIYCHGGRVNTEERFRQAHAGKLRSIDGTSGSRFALTIPQLVRWRDQLGLPV